MSNRTADGQRKNARDKPETIAARLNQWGNVGGPNGMGKRFGSKATRPSHETADKLHTKAKANGEMEVQGYSVPTLANPGNIIKCIVGGGVMGSKLSHENEAPFPESLAEFFIRSFCPPGGTALDIFSGSGTTVAVAARCGRNGIGVDIRESQVALGRRRVSEVQTELIA